MTKADVELAAAAVVASAALRVFLEKLDAVIAEKGEPLPEIMVTFGRPDDER